MSCIFHLFVCCFMPFVPYHTYTGSGTLVAWLVSLYRTTYSRNSFSVLLMPAAADGEVIGTVGWVLQLLIHLRYRHLSLMEP